MSYPDSGHLIFLRFILPLITFCLLLVPCPSQAQGSGDYSREELAQMLAPIALYPDTLLSQILMASTYPIEVIEADRWVERNPGLEADALDDALQDMDWDPSVKAICHFPSVLALMSERINETTNLGNAFLDQESEVMEMVQELRAKAYAEGNLASDSNQTVVVEKETIIIEPASPRAVYVPYYDPFSIYGPWWYPAYPPAYWGPPGVSVGFGLAYWPGIYFSFAFGSWSYFDWHHHHIYIDAYKRPGYVRYDHWRAKPGAWQHAPSHRRGFAYRGKTTGAKYDQPSRRSYNHWQEPQRFPRQAASARNEGQRDGGRSGNYQTGRSRGDSGPGISPRHQQAVEHSRILQQRTDQERRSKAEPEGSRRRQQDAARRLALPQRDDQGLRARTAAENGRQARQVAGRTRVLQQNSIPERQARGRTYPQQKDHSNNLSSRKIVDRNGSLSAGLGWQNRQDRSRASRGTARLGNDNNERPVNWSYNRR